MSKSQRSVAAREFLANIVESSDDAIFGKTLEGIITSWNRGAESLYGYAPSEIVGKNVSILAPAERAGEIDSILRQIAAGQRVDHFETERLRKDGQRLQVAITVSPVCDPEGRVVGASTIARDITERKRAEQTLRSTEKLAAMGRMAASIAHEINSPLDAAKNIVYLLKLNSSLDETAKNLLNILEVELNHVIEVSTRTLSFSRESDVMAPVHLTEVLDGVLSMFQRQIDLKSIRVERKFEWNGMISVYPGPIRQVCLNLISNALDVIPRGGRLRVHVHEAPNFRTRQQGVRVAIADTGPGIAKQFLEQIFQPFFTTKGEKGTGLGLWITRDAVEKHGGVIRVKSKLGAGSCFMFFLPQPSEVASEKVEKAS